MVFCSTIYYKFSGSIDLYMNAVLLRLVTILSFLALTRTRPSIVGLWSDGEEYDRQ